MSSSDDGCPTLDTIRRVWQTLTRLAHYDLGMPTEPSPGLRERTRRAVQIDITEAAMRLFAEHGFDGTTVEQIASEVGISSRSFFRYFGTKEDVVLGNLAQAGLELQAALEARPRDEAPWVALRAAFDVLVSKTTEHPDVSRRLMRMLVEAPSLRARHLEKQLHWQTLLIPDIEQRLHNLGSGSASAPDARAAALVAAALSCLDAATAAWAQSTSGTGLAEILDDAVAAVRQ
jgi:AcrR family transcriptional regulator